MPDKHKEFWQWFADHESEFFNVDAENKMEREHLFDDMAVELQNINPDLTFEFGPSSEKREFVISAGGKTCLS